MKERKWSVYKHTNLINGKVYIGVARGDVSYRWKNGKGYKENDDFYEDIEKYKWNKGFVHEVLFENLTQKQAWRKEAELIQQYKCLVPQGYNQTKGNHRAIRKVRYLPTGKVYNSIREAVEQVYHYQTSRDMYEVHYSYIIGNIKSKKYKTWEWENR